MLKYIFKGLSLHFLIVFSFWRIMVLNKKVYEILTYLLTWYLYSRNINTYIHSIHMNLNLLDQSQSKV